MNDNAETTPSSLVSAAFPELVDYSSILSFLADLGFHLGSKSFCPSAKQHHIDLLVAKLFPGREAGVAERLISKITERNTIGGMRTRLAVLKISGGSIDALKSSVERALSDDRDVMMDAELRQINTRKPPQRAKGLPDHTTLKFREYVVWLLRYLEPKIYSQVQPD